MANSAPEVFHMYPIILAAYLFFEDGDGRFGGSNHRPGYIKQWIRLGVLVAYMKNTSIKDGPTEAWRPARACACYPPVVATDATVAPRIPRDRR